MEESGRYYLIRSPRIQPNISSNAINSLPICVEHLSWFIASPGLVSNNGFFQQSYPLQPFMLSSSMPLISSCIIQSFWQHPACDPSWSCKRHSGGPLRRVLLRLISLPRKTFISLVKSLLFLHFVLIHTIRVLAETWPPTLAVLLIGKPINRPRFYTCSLLTFSNLSR